MSEPGAGSGWRCGVLGDPIGHSLSPALHRAAYAATGLDWTYAAHRVPAGGLAAFVAACDDSWRGLSLTMPLKREALAVADRVSATAEAAGAANTLVLTDGPSGRFVTADNTDVPGARAALREARTPEPDSASILGGGATAGSMLLALADAGCRRFRVHVRDEGRAVETLAVAERFDGALSIEIVGLDVPPSGDLVVSTIPASAQSPSLAAACARAPVVFDVIYDPWPTPIAAAAGAAGALVVGGLDLLVHQAALQFTLFTGLPAPLARMRSAGEAELAAAGLES